MKNKIYLFLFFINFFIVKSEYTIFELNTYKNKSNYPEEYLNYFYESFWNILYSKISIGPKEVQYIMELTMNTIGFSIYNYNCNIPPINSDTNPPLLPNFSNSMIIEHVEDNMTDIEGEYFIYILNNTIKIKTEKEEKNVFVDYIFSPRDNKEYIKKIVLRPYTCFSLGFLLRTKKIEEDEYALNLLFQFKKMDIINSYNWFIEYDSENKEKAKLILGAKPYEYNNNKYKEKNEKIIEAERRLDKMIYWDLKMNEIYLMENKEKIMIENYYTCSLEPNLGIIIGTIGYKNYLEEKIFTNDLREQNKCFKEKILPDKFIMYYCNKEMKNHFQKSENIKLYFNHRYFGKTFELDFNDLFEEIGNFIFFKIFFDEGKTDIWRLGKHFLIKYFFSYNFDRKTISYYTQEKDEENKETNDDDNNSKYRIILIIVIIVLALAFLICGFFFGRYLYIYRKKRIKNAEELIDEEKIGDVNVNTE